MVTLLLVATCSYPVFLVALAFSPASSRSQQRGNVLWLSVCCRPPAIHPASSSLQRWGGGAQVLLGVRLSLGRGSPCCCCPLVCPVPTIVVPCPPTLFLVLAVVIPVSSPVLSPCPHRCHLVSLALSSWSLSLLCRLVLGPGFLSLLLSSYLSWVVVSSSG